MHPTYVWTEAYITQTTSRHAYSALNFPLPVNFMATSKQVLNKESSSECCLGERAPMLEKGERGQGKQHWNHPWSLHCQYWDICLEFFCCRVCDHSGGASIHNPTPARPSWEVWVGRGGGGCQDGWGLGQEVTIKACGQKKRCKIFIQIMYKVIDVLFKFCIYAIAVLKYWTLHFLHLEQLCPSKGLSRDDHQLVTTDFPK